MKKLLIIPILFLISQAFGAIAYVQSAGKDGTGPSDNLAYSGNVTAKSLLVVAARSGSSTVGLTGVSDTLTNTWARAIVTYDAAGHTQEIWWTQTTNGGANTVTLTQSSGQSLRFIIAEYSGFNTAAVDVSTSAINTNASPDSQSRTPTVDNTLAFSACEVNNDASFTQGSGYTKRQTVTTKISIEDKNVGSATSTNGTWTLGGSDDWIASLVIFKDTAGGGPTLPTGKIIFQ